MITSLKHLFSSPHNNNHKAFALKRFLYWKLIRAFKLKNIPYKLWEDRKIFLNHDSFQSMWVMYNYIVDWEEFNLIKCYVKHNHQVCDIGSNMGFYTIWMSKFIGREGNIHSFEPDKSNFERLQNNVILNNLKKTVKLNNNAVSDIDGMLSFTSGLDGENHIDNTNISSLSVESKKLDTYAHENNIQSFNYVKIDVEGFEYSVLKGAETLLSTHKIAILQLEINSTLSNSNTNVDDVLKFLDTFNYKLCTYDVKNHKMIHTNYTKSRENYFAVFDIDLINQQLATTH